MSVLLRYLKADKILFLGTIIMAVTCNGGVREKELPVSGKQFMFKGCPAFIMAPESKAGAVIPWILYAPTRPETPGPEEKWMFERFLQAGIAIAGIDVGESFGSPQGTAVFNAFYDELVKNRGFAPKVCLMPRSRGGLMLYNWGSRHPQAVACIAGIYPVGDLRSYPGLKNACGAYGISEAALSAQLAQYNPIDLLFPLARAHVPIFHIHGDVDITVPLESNSGEIARRYRALGGEMTLIVPPGQGHSYWSGFFQCGELVDFVIAHLKK